MDQCEIIGDKGTLRFSFFTGAKLEIISSEGTEIMEFTNPVNIQLPMIEKVVHYFRGEGENPCSIDDAHGFHGNDRLYIELINVKV